MISFIMPATWQLGGSIEKVSQPVVALTDFSPHS